MINLLQIVDTVTKASNISDTNNDGKISLVELLQLGGWIMIPLAVLFVATIYVFFRAPDRHPQGFQHRFQLHEHHP